MKVTIKKTIEVDGFACVDNIIEYLDEHGYVLSSNQKQALKERGNTYKDKHHFLEFESLLVEVGK